MKLWWLWTSLAIISCGPQTGVMGEPGEPGPMGEMGVQGSTGPGALVREVTGTGQIAIGLGTTTFTLIPGLATTVDVPAGAVLAVHTDGGLQCTGIGNAFSVVDVAIFIDSLETSAVRRVVAANTAGVAQIVSNWSFSRTFTVAAGSHLVEVRAVGGVTGEADANVSSAAAPQLQAVMSVTQLQPAP